MILFYWELDAQYYVNYLNELNKALKNNTTKERNEIEKEKRKVTRLVLKNFDQTKQILKMKQIMSFKKVRMSFLYTKHFISKIKKLKKKFVLIYS